ncbi:hypothetical protein ACFWC9_41330, partial [Streptomyces goshikiensis]|uniref:hypothetical protein n=1 Tax=Streptomyces goshikiensis TaxID=1942 RepID=UPI0036818B22
HAAEQDAGRHARGDAGSPSPGSGVTARDVAGLGRDAGGCADEQVGGQELGRTGRGAATTDWTKFVKRDWTGPHQQPAK